MARRSHECGHISITSPVGLRLRVGGSRIEWAVSARKKGPNAVSLKCAEIRDAKNEGYHAQILALHQNGIQYQYMKAAICMELPGEFCGDQADYHRVDGDSKVEAALDGSCLELRGHRGAKGN